MKFLPTPLQGLVLIEAEPMRDHRGEFARTFCENEFGSAGLPPRFVQSSYSFNLARGTLRGMHYQDFSRPEGKLVRCTRGAIFDVALDLRPDSPTFLKWHGVELSAEDHRSFWIPAGFAHGFQTLTDSAEVYYQMDAFFEPGLARGVRYNDPAFGIRWPLGNPILSDRDRSLPDFGKS